MKNRVTLITAAAILIMVCIGSTISVRGNLLAAQASNYVTGRVTSASSGRPAASVWVIVKQGESEKGRSLTGDDGSYYIGNLSDGYYEMVIMRGRGHRWEKVTLPQNKVFNITIDF